jgi:hypothetical protein
MVFLGIFIPNLQFSSNEKEKEINWKGIELTKGLDNKRI